MASEIPSADQVRQRLLAMSWAEVRDLCARTDAPFTTVWKVRCGETTNPGIETVRRIWAHMPEPTVNG
jgi:hypothetical protein